MHNLLKKHRQATAIDGASSTLRKKAVDSFLIEMGREGVGTTYDREWQTGGNPFANSRDKDVAVPTLNDPGEDQGCEVLLQVTTASVDLSTGMVDGPEGPQPRQISPDARDKNLRSQETKNDLAAEKRKDEKGYSVTSAKYDFESDYNKRIAKKIASNHLFRTFANSDAIRVDNDSLVVNIPRGKFATAEFGLTDIANMEKEISTSLNVQAKFAHVMFSSGFDGISLEFLLV